MILAGVDRRHAAREPGNIDRDRAVRVVPFPSRPKKFQPQHLAAPTRVTAQVKRKPVLIAVTLLESPETSTGTERFVVVPFPSVPSRLSPQHLTAPPLITAQLWRKPAPIAVAVTGTATVK